MVLKDTLVCPECGDNMYSCSFDKKWRRIGYRCCVEDCELEMEFGFDDFIYLMINRIYDLFEISVNEDGEILDEE